MWAASALIRVVASFKVPRVTGRSSKTLALSPNYSVGALTYVPFPPLPLTAHLSTFQGG
jgi:hypothetical protein